MAQMTVEQLQALGFDQSHTVCEGTVSVVECSQCTAVVLNGTPVHEHGCPNATHACQECGVQTSRRFRLCDDCGKVELW